ncbi:MAG: phage terminase large subunit [Rickettsiales bacterium]|nr:phage terminase large subunit [Rickettsiales bacterium]
MADLEAPADLEATGRFRDFAALWNESIGLGTPAHHLRIADFLQRTFESPKRRGLLLAFRGSGKSSVVALFICWLLGRDPNTRIAVLSADIALAKKMVRNVKRIIESHPALAFLVPRKPSEWAAGSFTCERSMTLRDPSVMAASIAANFTGSRADIIVCDDVEVPKNSNTRAKRECLRERLVELEFVLVPGGCQIFIGTPQSRDTIYKV